MLTTRDDLNGLNASTGSRVPSMGPNPSHGYIGRGTPIPWGGGPNPSHGYIGRGTMVPWSGDPHPMGPPAGMTTFGTPFGHVPTIFDAGSIGIPDLGPPKRGPGEGSWDHPFWGPLFERFWPVRPKPSKSLCSP